MKNQYLYRHKPPDSPGVYVFRDYRKRPLYIGRATSLADRVKSYLGNDLIKMRGPRLVDMVAKARSVTWQTTRTVLESVVLESLLIKRYQPYYNVDDRDDKSSLYVVITDEPWPRVFLARARDLEENIKEGKLPYEIKWRFGPYPDARSIKIALKILRRLFPFKDKKAHDPRHEEFYRALGWSPKDGGDDARALYQKTIRKLAMFFQGKSEALRSGIEREMDSAAKRMLFEEAQQLKRLLYALDHINDIALIKADGEPDRVGSRRIEAYDVAHLSGTDVVGAMVVFVAGQAQPSEYRRFKISREENNDLASLAEMLNRRLNHSEWHYADMIVVDGNEMHVRTAESVLKARRISIPVVGVTKDERHRAYRLIGNSELVEKLRKEIVAANAEAHRFAVTYHRQRRRHASRAR